MTRRHFLSVLSLAPLAVTPGCGSTSGRASINSRRQAISRRAAIRQARINAIQARAAAARNSNAVTKGAQDTVKAGQSLMANVLQTIEKFW